MGPPHTSKKGINQEIIKEITVLSKITFKKLGPSFNLW
jgi:hypothetical protein